MHKVDRYQQRMVGLTASQKDELHKAILEYLEKNGYNATAQAFSEESQVEPFPDNVSSTKKDLLEKKWTSVVRLKKQVMELER